MIQTVIEFVLGIVVEFLMALFWWFILFPVVWLVSLPVILMIALFRRGSYRFAVNEMRTSVHCFWRNWGFCFTPWD